MPWIEHKNLLNAHSHFAFMGWVGYMLLFYVLKITFISKGFSRNVQKYLKIYQWNVWLMVPLFLAFGYAWPGMILLGIHIGLSIWFAIWWLKNRRTHPLAGRIAVDMATAFNLLSFIGTLALAVLKAYALGNAYDKQNALYVFLHYQYNGFFLLMCLGIFAIKYPKHFESRSAILGIRMYGAAVLLGIGLVWLMWHKPIWLTGLNYAVGVGILTTIFLIGPAVMKTYRDIKTQLPFIVRLLWSLSLFGCILKAVLQAASAIPAVGYMVYEHRSIAIGYLHLVFLIIITFYLLGLILAYSQKVSKATVTAVILFIIGALMNEVLLALQGLGAIVHLVIHHTDIWLIGIAALMFLGLLCLRLTMNSNKKTDTI
ncbi:MAG: hypothetical protein KG003_06150 [Bacteroidetes bacterium]|nr:hypothetical protein [Bacteroidota bacterium]